MDSNGGIPSPQSSGFDDSRSKRGSLGSSIRKRKNDGETDMDHNRDRHHRKRVSGFDMGPPASAMLQGQVPRVASPFATFLRTLPARGQLPVVPVIVPSHAMIQQATQYARRVYVGDLSPAANEQSVATFFNKAMSAMGGNTAGPGDAVVNVYINHEKEFAFVEMRSVEEASNAMTLDGIIFEGTPVKVRRPSDYNPALAGSLGPSQPNPGLNLAAVRLAPGFAGGLEGPDCIFVGGLPYCLTESQVRELLESCGALCGFYLVKDMETGKSKGYAFCAYSDLSVTDIACAVLNGIVMGDKILTVRRANQGMVQPRPVEETQESILLHAQLQIVMQKANEAQPLRTKVVCLTNVVNGDELNDDENYEDIMDDMRREGKKYGVLLSIVIPRASPNGKQCPGTGNVFLEYAYIDEAVEARKGLNGWMYGENKVLALFYEEAKYHEGKYA